MNKVFLSGKLTGEPGVAYTPKGEKIVIFPLAVEEGSFSIDVLCKDSPDAENLKGKKGLTVLASGELEKSGKTKNMFRLKANKIVWMEE